MANDSKATAKAEPKDLGQSKVQATIDDESAKGFRGVEVDPTPNEHYTLSGVNAGLPTPETNSGAEKAARERQITASGKFGGKPE